MSTKPSVAPLVAAIDTGARVWGMFDELGLTVRYDFTRADSDRIGEPGSEPRRTIFHETTHLYQTVATSYGAYISRIKTFQSTQVLGIVRRLREYGVPVRYPLAQYVLTLEPTKRFEKVHDDVIDWYLAETLRLYLEQNPTYSDAYALVHAATGHTFASLFTVVDNFLRWHDGETGQAGEYDFEPRRDAIRDGDPRRDAMLLRLGATGLDGVGVMESAASAAENWGLTGKARDHEDLAGPNTPSRNWEGLALALKSWPGLERGAFAIAYGALADLALCAPILPEHARLRRPGATFHDLHPVARLIDALFTTDVEPAEAVADVPRYQQEVCDRHEWPTPWELAHASEVLPRSRQLTDIHRLIHRAQVWRSRLPTMFLDLDVWTQPAERGIADFQSDFSHSVIEFSDRTLYHHERARVFALLLQYTRQQFLRALMLSRTPAVTLPFRASDTVLEAFADGVRSLLRDSAGLDSARVTIRPHAAHSAAQNDSTE